MAVAPNCTGGLSDISSRRGPDVEKQVALGGTEFCSLCVDVFIKWSSLTISTHHT
jgi:hypothetical protein